MASGRLILFHETYISTSLQAFELHQWGRQEIDEAAKNAGESEQRLQFDWQQLGLMKKPQHTSKPNVASFDSSSSPRLALLEKSIEIAKARQSIMDKDRNQVEAAGVEVRPISQSEAQFAMNEFQRRTSAAALDRSCTCAVCNRMTPPSSSTFSLESPEIADLFDHSQACKAGFPLSSIRVYDEESETYIPATDANAPPVEPPNPRRKLKGTEVEVEVVLETTSDSENDLELTSDDDEPQMTRSRGRVAAVRRDGSIDVHFHDVKLEPPPCPGDDTCPLRSQHHGFHAVEQEDNQWVMYCLLADRKSGWDSGRGSSDVVDSWINKDQFITCADCAKSLKKRTPELPKYSVLNHHLQLVPPVPPENTRVSDEEDGRVSYWNGSRDASVDEDGNATPSTYEVLPCPSLALQQMIAAFKPTSFVFRLISSYTRDKKREASGKSVFDGAAEQPRFVDHDDEYKSTLQKAHKGGDRSYSDTSKYRYTTYIKF